MWPYRPGPGSLQFAFLLQTDSPYPRHHPPRLVDQIYGSALPAALKPAATHGCLLHLAKLVDERVVARHPRRDRVASGAEVEGEGEGEVAVEHEELHIPEGWHDGWTLAAA